MPLPVFLSQPDDFHPRPFGVTKAMARLQTSAQIDVFKRQVENWKAAAMAADDLDTNARLVQMDFDEVTTFYDANLQSAAGSKVKEQALAESIALLTALNSNVVLRYAR